MRFSSLILVIVICGCCDSKMPDKFNMIHGKWEASDSLNSSTIYFGKNNYQESNWNIDVNNESKGKYFLNTNQGRCKMTISFVPDLIINKQDTLMQECFNLDIISLDDSILIVKLPNKLHLVKNESLKKYLTYRKL